MQAPRSAIVVFALAGLCFTPDAIASAGSVTILRAEGDVKARLPREKAYKKVIVGEQVPDNSRLRTGANGQATIRFPDNTEAKLAPKSEIIVRAKRPESKQANGASLFFGRLWSKVVKSVGGKKAFEVQSANAVAGVRGTEFEVGVADDGSTRVVVSKGSVGVGGDSSEGSTNVGPGYEVESDGAGRLGRRRKLKGDPNWSGWFAKRARKLEKEGLKVAKNLDGRLNRRKAKVEKLVKKQRALRKTIERLEAQKKRGADVNDQLHERMAELERVTERLVDMQARLQAAFGIFERWGAVARSGGMAGGDQVIRMSDSMAKIAADFADMIEEGTDQSEEGMHEMMDDIKGGGSLRPKKKRSAADELF